LASPRHYKTPRHSAGDQQRLWQKETISEANKWTGTPKFDRFKQVDASTTRRYRGLGLGLSLVKQLVELHGGTVRAKSDGPGKGATFVVSLPLIVFHPPSEERGRQHPRSRSGEVPLLPLISLKNATLLVIDDDPDACNLLKRLLESTEATVYVARSAED